MQHTVHRTELHPLALPFVGRDAEHERLVQLWYSAADAPQMQLALIVGEAGVGKSRLLEEFSREVGRMRGTVIHVKLFPESSTLLVQPLARAIGLAQTGLSLLRQAPVFDLASVISAISRAARLRRTVLIIEDVHLLGPENRGEVHSLLEMLAEEQMLVLLAARPVELAVAPVIEEYRPLRIAIGPLALDAVRSLLAETAPQASEDFAEALHRLTAGNPLALRSALRSITRLETSIRNEAADGAVEPATFEAIAGRSVGLLSEGMIAHLSRDERENAERLALFGEIVAHETAAAVLAEPAIASLIEKGIIAHTDSPVPPLAGPDSAGPLLAFTHSLLHRHFVENASANPNEVLRITSHELPLYSILPLLALAGTLERAAIEPELLEAAYHRLLRVVIQIDATPDWHKAEQLLDVAAEIAERLILCMPTRTKAIRTQLVEHRLRSMRRREWDARYGGLLDELFTLTADPASTPEAEARIYALVHRLRVSARTSETVYDPTIWREIDDLCERWPDLIASGAYARFLRDVANVSDFVDDWATLRDTERRVNQALSLQNLPDAERRFYLHDVSSCFLRLCDTPEEVELRTVMAATIALAPNPNTLVPFTVARFHYTIGALRDCIRKYDDLIPKLRAQGLPGMSANARLCRLQAEAALGLPMEVFRATAESSIATVLDGNREHFRSTAHVTMMETAVLRGAYTWARENGLQHADTPVSLDAREYDLLLAITSRDSIATIRRLLSGTFRNIPAICAAMLAEDAERDGARREAERYMARTPLTMAGIMVPHIAIATVEVADREHGWGIADELRGQIAACARRALAWLDERGVVAYMAPILECARHYLAPGEFDEWQGRAAAHERRLTEAMPARRGGVELSMLGAVEIRRGGDRTRPRGVRMRSVLGLLVADRMVARPLEPREFQSLAVGAGRDHDDARNSVNVTIHRLRDMLGHDAILTRDGKPELNLDHVDVDLLRAEALIATSRAALRNGALRTAHENMAAALRVMRSDVPFPSLYDDFFEALRDDIENRLRSALLDIARELLRNGDAEGAEELLRPGFEAVPGDEEIAELLRQALIELGMRAEARRVELKAAGQD